MAFGQKRPVVYVRVAGDPGCIIVYSDDLLFLSFSHKREIVPIVGVIQ